jgi:AcrR family transcriptional regulator
VSQNAILPDVADRIAQATRVRRGGTDYAAEVRRLLDAGLEVMRRCGTSSSPRVADIVAEAGLSNDAFYRHFASKEALVTAILEDGTSRLCSYLDHQMAKEREPIAKVRRWAQGVLAQAADDEIASTTRAVMWNGGVAGERLTSGPSSPAGQLAGLVRDALAQLGSRNPDLDASLAAHATLGRMQELLWARARPKRGEVDGIVAFVTALATAGRR